LKPEELGGEKIVLRHAGEDKMVFLKGDLPIITGGVGGIFKVQNNSNGIETISEFIEEIVTEETEGESDEVKDKND